MFFTAPTITLVVVSITCLILLVWKKNSKLPPGPLGLPFVGYYPFLSPTHYLDFNNLRKRYGDVISFRTVGGSLVVVLNGLNVIKDVLVNRSEEFIGRPKEHNLVTWISNGLGIAQEEGSVWKEHRRFFLQTAKSFGFGKQESEKLIQEEVRTLVKDLKNENGGPADIKFHVAYVANSVACQILFSTKFDKYEGFFRQISDSAAYLVEMFADQRYMLVGPIYEYLVMKFFPSTKRIRKSRELFRKIIEEIVNDHVKTFDPEHQRDFIDAYLYQAYKLDKSGSDHSFTMKRLHSISFNMLMEGTESVGGTVQALLELASQHVDEQKRVQEELDSIVGRERLPSCLDRPKLPYFEAFVQELYRHNMPFNISTHYCNFKETTIQGYRIPSRTIVVANYWTINNDPALYPEPEKFDPRRFIDENGKKIKTEGPYPFGIGKRACIGESLAQMEVFLIMASVLQNFTLYPANKSGFLKAVPRQ